jgi:hypothetical protein
LEDCARDLCGTCFAASSCFGGDLGGMSSSWPLELAPPWLNDSCGDSEWGDLEGRDDGLGDDGGGCG